MKKIPLIRPFARISTREKQKIVNYYSLGFFEEVPFQRCFPVDIYFTFQDTHIFLTHLNEPQSRNIATWHHDLCQAPLDARWRGHTNSFTRLGWS